MMSYHLLLGLIFVTLAVLSESSNPNRGLNPNLSRQTTSSSGGAGNSLNTPFRSLVGSNTCKNKNSPAAQCFDYFILAIFWAPGYAYKMLHSGRNYIINGQLPNKWIIHGLWPSMYDGKEVPDKCLSTRSSNFRKNDLDRQGLLAKLGTDWKSILSPFKMNDPDTAFWKHEYVDHGRCATRSANIGDVFGYFQITHELYESINIDYVAREAGYREGNSASLKTVLNNIEQRLNNKVKLNFIINDNYQENYLTELMVCYDLELNRMDCPGAGLMGNRILQKLLTYSPPI